MKRVFNAVRPLACVAAGDSPAMAPALSSESAGGSPAATTPPISPWFWRSGSEDFRSVIVIHPLQSRIRQAESIEAPVIVELFGFVEVLVQGLQDPKCDPVHRFFKAHIGSVDKTIRVFGIELGGKARYGSGLGVTGGNVGIQVGITVE